MSFGQLNGGSSFGDPEGGGKQCYEIFVARVTVQKSSNNGWTVAMTPPFGIPAPNPEDYPKYKDKFPDNYNLVVAGLASANIFKACVCLSYIEKVAVGQVLGNTLWPDAGSDQGEGFRWQDPAKFPRTYKGYSITKSCKGCTNDPGVGQSGSGSCPCSALWMINLSNFDLVVGGKNINSESTHYTASDGKQKKLDNPGKSKSVIMQIIREERKIKLKCGKKKTNGEPT